MPPAYEDKRFLFVATGTGIAPFHSILGSFPHIDYQLYHGVRCVTDCYAREAFSQDRYHACLSRETGGVGGAYMGRVTQVLGDATVPRDAECYLCGSCDMIYDMFAILQRKGIPREHIHAETYY